MSDAKKPSLEEILAACRKQGAGAPAAASSAVKKDPDHDSSSTTSPPGAADAKPDAKEAVSSKPAALEKGKMSVAEILAAARKNKEAGGAAATTPAPRTTPAKPVADPAVKGMAANAKPAAKSKVDASVATLVKDTGSILAAARKVDRPGPMSKEEAARKEKESPDPKKKSVIVPPKPEKPAYAVAKPKAEPVDNERRGFMNLLFGSSLAIGFTSLGAWSALGGLGLARFMFPNIRTEPPSRFKIGFPAEFPPDAVATRFTAQFGIWVVNVSYEGQRQIVALKTVCTHLGCTPNWLEAEQKFKCPCHGSGFYKDGINFEGPAPRPLERYAIRLSDDGQLEVDKSKKFQQEMGQWSNPACFVPV